MGGNMSNETRQLARLAERAAARAGAYLAGVTRPEPSQWASKGHHDFVTIVDQTAEAMIVETLLRAEPGSRVLGEEHSPEERDTSGLLWVIDPLDGTTNFLHGYPSWSVSIGAAIDGTPVAGTVFHVPARRRYTAWQGGGAWAGGERLRVSTISEPTHALIGTGFPFKVPSLIPEYVAQFERVLPLTSGVRRAGSAALDLTDVALGRFDAFWELVLAPWDTAAGIILVREAGGIVTDMRGEPARVAHGGVVAGNAVMHGWMLRLLDDG